MKRWLGGLPLKQALRRNLQSVLAEATLLPLASAIVLIWEPRRPVPFALLGGTYLLVNYGFKRLADLASEYKFEPADGGKATLITFTQTSKDKGGLPVESLQKGALKETYVRQVQMVNKALGLNQAPATTPPAGG